MVQSVNTTNRESLIQMPSWLPQAEIVQKLVSGTAKTFRCAVTFVDAVAHNVPASVNRCANITKGLGFFNIVTNVPKGINSAWGALMTSSPVVRVEKAWQSAIAFGSAAEGFVDTVAFLKATGAVAANALSWTAKITPIVAPLNVVSLLFTTQSYAKTQEFYNEMKGRIKPLSGTHKVEDLTAACEAIIKNKDRFNKICKIGNEAKIDERARTILEGLSQNQEEALQKGEEFLKVMSRRVHTAYGFEVTGLALSISRTVTSVLSLSTPPNPVVPGIALAVFGLILVQFATSTVMLNSNPFSKPDNVWHQKLLHGTREGVYQAVERSNAWVQSGVSQLSSRIYGQTTAAAA